MEILGKKVGCVHLGDICTCRGSQIKFRTAGCYLAVEVRQRFCYSCLETEEEYEAKRIEQKV